MNSSFHGSKKSLDYALAGTCTTLLVGTQVSEKMRPSILYGQTDNDRIYGGHGEDILEGDRGVDFLAGDDGSDSLAGGDDGDFLTGGADDNTLMGDDGIDHLFGDSGNDRIIGGSGDDRLTGGSDADVFVFSASDLEAGSDTIADFNTGDNTIEFKSSVFANFAAVQSAMTQVGRDVVINADGHSIILEIQTLADLTQDDFTFVA